MSSSPTWIDQVLNHLNSCLQWENPGVMRFAVTAENELIIAPAGIEQVGGRHDGAKFQSSFQLCLSEFLRVFDETPWVFWNAGRHSNVSLEGTIDGDRAIVLISQIPLPDDEYKWRIYEDGSLQGP